MSAYLKKFFANNKKYGSKDRKQISQLCYSFFRTGKSLQSLSVQERLLAGLYLSIQQPNELLQEVKPDWNESVADSIAAKFTRIEKEGNLHAVFPWSDALSKGIDHLAYCESFFHQPQLFVRLRPGFEAKAPILKDHGDRKSVV